MAYKLNIETLWESELRDELFVCMPFALKEKFDTINKSALEAGFKGGAKKADRDVNAEMIMDNILDGILNSKMILFDLSDDPKSTKKQKRINENVLIEIGIANAIRDKTDLIFIRNEKTENKLPFNINNIRYNMHGDVLDAAWLKEILKKAIENQIHYKTNRVRLTAQTLTPNELMIMEVFGRLPEKYWDNFLVPIFEDYEKKSIEGIFRDVSGFEIKITQRSIHRLLDFGIIRLNWSPDGNEISYWWTQHGYNVMKYLKKEKYTEKKTEEIYATEFLKGRRKNK
ncbi:MAG: hypothetical protein ABIJ10_01345 [Candidatus Micrarchaeota archaeon]|nr:hypothetical protein [Candidatus Micrarchaeota archaeon]MBU1886721.1 hypothetical protein [Candidatus Micrarchaeota archaeon]